VNDMLLRTQTPRAGTLRPVGFTLIELLVVIAILGLLIQLMLPAVMSSREAASQLSCTNNMRQIATAIQLHHDTHKYLPSGGWHYSWAGEPELGTGPEQPGGWIFNILSFVEEDALRSLGRDLDGAERAAAFGHRIKTPLALFHCPSRRPPNAYSLEYSPAYFSRDGVLSQVYQLGAKSDFAACLGSSSTTTDFFDLIESGTWSPPETLVEGNDPERPWPVDAEFVAQHGVETNFDGLIYSRSKVRYGQVTDGLSKVYLVGEKYLPIERYETGTDPGDNEHMYAGFNDDIQRSAYLLPESDMPEAVLQDQFGSAHPVSWNMAFADGSVRRMNFDIYLEAHRRLGSRNDSKPVTVE
jgi:prepilin-type N-terminal cleavage/methylation domain-containing protein